MGGWAETGGTTVNGFRQRWEHAGTHRAADRQISEKDDGAGGARFVRDKGHCQHVALSACRSSGEPSAGSGDEDRARAGDVQEGGHDPGQERRSAKPRSYLNLPTLPSADETGEVFIRALYAEHGDFLLAFVLRLTNGDRHWAEDVVQETMLRAWRHAHDLIGTVHHSLAPWLTTVARYIVSNHRRSRRARPYEVDDSGLETATVPDETEQALLRVVITESLRKISAAHREVLVELYLRGRTVEQVAKLLGVPPGTVKSRSYYAMRALRAVLRSRDQSQSEWRSRN
jgi:RNA polymerase sigma-70 factor (ECF subfamily)